jgi:DNA (cytosine-5)-methyltransferase 1
VADGSLFGNLRGPVVVDLFAGGGGASEGIRRATGHEPTVAINHDEHAIRMHGLNHPGTIHFHESVFDVRPQLAARGRPVDLLWASPECIHFSRARGGRPKSDQSRSSARIIVEWAREVGPRVIMIENVVEFTTWRPLDDDGYPVKARAGEFFYGFVEDLRGCGYAVEWRVLNAADYGAPTSRRRLFVIARRDGVAITWPTPTHGPGRAQPFRTAAECIDWSLPVPSIFERAKPLAEATQRRIAEGIRRFVLESPRPFLVHLTHGGRASPLDEPIRTVTAAHRGEQALVAPFVSKIDNKSSGPSAVRSIDAPLSTITLENGHALVAPFLVNTRNGEREGQAPRVHDPAKPWGTVTAQGSQGGLVAAFLAKHYGGVVGHGLDRPLGTVTAVDHHAAVAVFLDKLHGSALAGQPVDVPAPTVTAGGGRGGGHAALVAAFLCAYYGSEKDGQALDRPLRTIPTVDRFGLVTVHVDGEPYALVDIGMRMLQPHELAAANGWPGMKLVGTKSQQVARIGNMVVPNVVEALCRANGITGPESRRAVA